MTKDDAHKPAPSATASQVDGRIRSALFGIRIMTVFGLLWTIWAAFGTPENPHWLVWPGTLATIALLGTSVARQRSPASATSPTVRRGPAPITATATYRWIVVAEFAAVAAAVLLLRSATLRVWLPPVIAGIVGLHFLFMAWLLNVRRFWTVGGLILAGTVGTVLLWPPETAQAAQVLAQGLLMAVILYARAFLLLRNQRNEEA